MPLFCLNSFSACSLPLKMSLNSPMRRTKSPLISPWAGSLRSYCPTLLSTNHTELVRFLKAWPFFLSTGLCASLRNNPTGHLSILSKFCSCFSLNLNTATLLPDSMLGLPVPCSSHQPSHPSLQGCDSTYIFLIKPSALWGRGPCLLCSSRLWCCLTKSG